MGKDKIINEIIEVEKELDRLRKEIYFQNIVLVKERIRKSKLEIIK